MSCAGTGPVHVGIFGPARVSVGTRSALRVKPEKVREQDLQGRTAKRCYRPRPKEVGGLATSPPGGTQRSNVVLTESIKEDRGRGQVDPESPTFRLVIQLCLLAKSKMLVGL